MEAVEGDGIIEYQMALVWKMSLVVRNPVFGVFDQVRHKPGCAATEYV